MMADAVTLESGDLDPGAETAPEGSDAAIVARRVTVFYGNNRALFGVDLEVARNGVMALIGPSGCGKTTFIRCVNRMNDIIPDCRVEGSITLNGAEIYAPGVDVVQLRARVGMVFQRPNPFPKSIFDNVAYGPRIHGMARDRADLAALVETSLRRAALWDEVRDRLDSPGTSLSGGQQQRLCIARAIAVNPEVLLMDEPCSALDPIATAMIEELMEELSETLTILIVTHNLQQAARVSQATAFFLMGQVIEVGPTEEVFTRPRDERTHGYITGRFG